MSDVRWQKKVAQLQAEERVLFHKVETGIHQSEPNCKVGCFPNLIPRGPAAYILVTMEPSRFERMLEVATRHTFLHSLEDFIVHYTAHTWLSSRYDITDISKVAMPTADANR
ncbi:MAG: hypothetical protein HY905_06875 [Deltaproteobacteria bacterium]|nr:hypothetical protein [Deltaproteobacteria bacterium]